MKKGLIGLLVAATIALSSCTTTQKRQYPTNVDISWPTFTKEDAVEAEERLDKSEFADRIPWFINETLEREWPIVSYSAKQKATVDLWNSLELGDKFTKKFTECCLLVGETELAERIRQFDIVSANFYKDVLNSLDKPIRETPFGIRNYPREKSQYDKAFRRVGRDRVKEYLDMKTAIERDYRALLVDFYEQKGCVDEFGIEQKKEDFELMRKNGARKYKFEKQDEEELLKQIFGK